MNDLGFMTVALYLDYMAKHSSDQSPEELKKEYDNAFSYIKEAGYEYVDLSSWEADSMGLKCWLLLLQKYELKVSSYIHFESFAELEKDLQAGIKRAYEGVDKAALLGSEFLMIGIQDRGDIAENDPQKIREKLTAYFNAICEFAKGKKVRPVIENIPDAGLNLSKWEDVRAVMDSVPCLGYIFDSGTLLVAEQESKDYISALKDRLVYVHLKDMRETDDVTVFAFPSVSGKRLVNAPTGLGLVDVKTVLQQLKEAGYTGRISVEFCPDDDLPLSDSIRRSKKYLEELM